MRTADLFAGFGGFSTGAAQAGARIVWAANHLPLAVAAHAANHPEAEHSCQDLNQADWTAVPDVELLLAAPACQGHSSAGQVHRARDGKARRHHDALRSTAWAVIGAAEVKRPEVVLVENVPDFLRWELYDVWKLALQRLGYAVAENVLTASRFGVPQRRKRLFITATRSIAPLRLEQPDTPEPGFGPCIDWSAGEWRPVASRSAAVQRRVAAGRARHGDRFLTQHVTNHPGVPLDQPIRTVTKQDQWAVVDGDLMRPLTIAENIRAMGFPEDFAFPEDATRREMISGLGNAVCPPVARWLVEQVIARA